MVVALNCEPLGGVQVTMNGEVFGMFDSYPGSVFNSFGVEGDDVRTLTLKSVGATSQEWISLLEVSAPRIFS